jgi:flavodoxin
MKRTFLNRMLLTVVSLLAVACSSDEAGEVNAQTTGSLGKTLVVYYSYTNNCREIVTSLTSQIEADVLEIQPAEKGLKYEANGYALGTQLLNAIKANPNDASSYPAIDPVTISADGYQNIIIVTPLWWSQMAAPMQTYLFNNGSKMAGKRVGLIVSSHSSGISGVVNDAKRLLPDVTWTGDALWINASNHANRSVLTGNWLDKQNFDKKQNAMNKMYITIDGVTKSVTLMDNAATKALVEKLQNAPVNVSLNSSGGFEIWGALGFSLPKSDQQTTAQPGDVILYNGSNICMFYDTNSWSYTRLGKIDGLSENELRTFLKAGENNISVTLSLSSVTTAIQSSKITNAKEDKSYSLNGNVTTNAQHGIYIKNGKKVIL